MEIKVDVVPTAVDRDGTFYRYGREDTFQNTVSEPLAVFTSKAESTRKHPRLVTSSRVIGGKGIAADLVEINDSAVRKGEHGSAIQALRHSIPNVRQLY